MSTETNKQKARAFFESFDKGDMVAWRACLGPGFTAYMNGSDKPMTAQEFEGMASMFAQAFANGRHLIDRQLADGDWVATRMSWTAIHVAPFNGVPTSNRSVSIAAIAFDRFANGKIAEHNTVVDVMALMTQIGAIPAAA